MEVNQTHPIKIAFCEYLNRSLDQRDTTGNKYNKRFRNKWQVLNILIKYPQLKKQRKMFLYLQRQKPKVESFEHFLKRRVINLFSNDQIKKSRSTPDLLNETQKEVLNNELIGYRGSRYQAPPIPAKRNIIPLYSANVQLETSNLDSTGSSDNTITHHLMMNDTSFSSTSQYFSYNANNRNY